MNGSDLKRAANFVNMLKAIIFDCDGTVVDSEDYHYRAWCYAIEKQGGTFSLEEYYSFVGKPTNTIAHLLSERFGKERAEEIRRDKITRYHELQLVGIPPIEPTLDFIHRLAKEKNQLGLKLAMASALAKDEIVIHLKQLDIEHYFDAVISGIDDLKGYHDPEGVNKPKPYIYLHTAKVLGILPSECAVIEDSQTGVAAGVDAGCITIAVPNSYSCLQDFSRAHLKIKSLAGINGSGFVQTVAKLHELVSDPVKKRS